jgi:hypothetical protein
MVRAASALAILSFAALASAPQMAVVGVAATAAPKGTPPPEIYHIVTRPLCAELHQHIAPAIAMMLQNDRTIKQSPKLFSQYNLSALNGVDNSVSNSVGTSANGAAVTSGDASDGTLNADQNMALLGMENLISPIANNIIETQKLLDSPALMQGTGNPEDDKQLKDIRAKLLQALATQNAALDIVSGFVATEQMGDLQHSGQEYIAAINSSDQTNSRGGTVSMSGTPSPNPLMQNANQPGLPPNPYDIDLANVPGLTLGYNPVTRLLTALRWTIAETEKRENTASVAVMNGAQQCAAPSPQPAATQKPH